MDDKYIASPHRAAQSMRRDSFTQKGVKYWRYAPTNTVNAPSCNNQPVSSQSTSVGAASHQNPASACQLPNTNKSSPHQNANTAQQASCSCCQPNYKSSYDNRKCVYLQPMQQPVSCLCCYENGKLVCHPQVSSFQPPCCIPVPPIPPSKPPKPKPPQPPQPPVLPYPPTPGNPWVPPVWPPIYPPQPPYTPPYTPPERPLPPPIDWPWVPPAPPPETVPPESIPPIHLPAPAPDWILPRPIPIPRPEDEDEDECGNECLTALAGIAIEEYEIAGLIAAERMRLEEVIHRAPTVGEVIKSTAASKELMDSIYLVEEKLVEKMKLLLKICTCEDIPEVPIILCGCDS